MGFIARSLATALAFTATGCMTTPGPSAQQTRSDAVAGDYLQARFAASQQNYDQAADAFARAVDRDGSAPLTASAFRYALATGNIEDAERFAAMMLSSPDDGDDTALDEPGGGAFVEADLPRLTLVASAFKAGRLEQAETALGTSFDSVLGKSIAHYLRAWTTYLREDAEAASDRLRDVPEGVYLGFAPLQAGLMFDLEGRSGPAEALYAQAVQGPSPDLAVMAIAGLYERTGRKDQAHELYQKMSEDQGFMRRVGRLGLARLGDPLPGETRAFRTVGRRMPTRLAENAADGAGIVFLNFAWSTYEQVIQRQEAAERAGFARVELSLDVPLALAQLALAADPELGAAHYLVGAITAANGQYDLADAANRRVQPSSWLYNYAVIDRADALVAMGQQAEAIELLQTYSREDALAPDVVLTLADLLADAGRTEEAMEAASHAIEIADRLSSEDTRSDNLWRYYFARGVIGVDAGQWDSAEADLRRALELAPGEPMLLNFLGYSYVERGENIDEAFGMIERALAERPNSGAITDSLGWAYYQRGDYETAVRYLERAVSLEPGDGVITDHLGDAYWRAGRQLEARYEWRRVVDGTDADAALKDSARAKLAGEKEPSEASLLADRTGQGRD